MDVSCVTSYHNLTLPKPIKVLKAVPKSHAIRDDVRISAWSLGVQAPTTDTRSNYQSISLKSYRKNQVIYQILQVHHIYKHIFQYDVITPGRWHHQRFSAASPRRMMSGFTYRPVVPAVCGRLGTGGRSSGLGGFLHHDIEKLHFHDLPGKTKKMLVICHMYIQ